MDRFSRKIISFISYRSFRLDCTVKYAGHSKWANIKHIKAIKDGQKSEKFTRLSRQIRLAIQDGGTADPAFNSLLRNAIDESVRKNMPQQTIKTILKKYSEPRNNLLLKKYFLEIKLLNKIFLVISVCTDNLIGTKMSLSTLLRKSGGKFTDTRHVFTEKGIIIGLLEKNLELTGTDFENMCTEHAIDNDIEEFEIDESSKNKCIFICAPRDLQKIQTNLTKLNWIIEHSEHTFISNINTHLNEDELILYQSFKNKLISIDGVEDIYDTLTTIT